MRLPIALAAALISGPTLAQTPDPHAGHNMPPAAADPHAGHRTPAAPPAADPHARHAMPPPAADPHAGHAMPAPATDPHAGHAMPAPSADPHAGHATPAPADAHAGHAMPAQRTGADLPVGQAAAPPVPADNLADAVYDRAAMERSRGILREEHGGARLSQVMLDEAEATTLRDGGYRWKVEAWVGGDHNRFVVKSEGEGLFDHGVEDAEVQALWSRPVGVYTDLQVGVRHDFEPGPQRTYATVGFETLAPYWFELEGAAFLSDEGELSARLEGSYDLRLAQRLVLQSRGELDLSAEDVPERGIGSGLSEVELGLRLRYEIKREFAPYVGVVWSRKVGDTADFARAEGEDVEETRAVFGLRAWF